ncbi:MAG: 2-oxo acid dehydrogenase subunit E2 [Thermomicrobiales bacterium]|nr:2-oxo acid dehydrogenase subunit E2 [Thermomicrobiales bacterium]
MPNEIVMPRLGWTMEVGTVVEWLKTNGDPVEAGDHIFSVESDKAITEVEALDSGVLYIPEATPIGVEVPVGAPLGFILDPGEPPPAYTFGSTAAPQPQDLGSPVDDDIPTDPAPVGASNGSHNGVMPVSPRAPGGGRAGRRSRYRRRHRQGGRIREQDVRAAAATLPPPAPEPRATPSVRKLAEEIGVDLRTVPSSRPSGRITRADLNRGVPATSMAEGVSAPIGPIRRSIRDRMSETARTVAPVTLTTEADATDLWNVREQLKRDLLRTPAPGLRPPSITDLLVRISALALVDQPEMNVRLDGDAMTQYDAAHIGIAVDTERGLLAPVLRDADRKSIHDIAAESAELIEKTRDGSIGGDRLKGSTFTVSNLGMFEIDAFTPIINLPEAAILGVGRIVPKPVVIDVEEETIAIRRMLYLSLTFDHRVVDGAPAARFLQRIKGMIEQPLVALTR